jgi:predicted Holliday junction resolvase-like endonuclease
MATASVGFCGSSRRAARTHTHGAHLNESKHKIKNKKTRSKRETEINKGKLVIHQRKTKENLPATPEHRIHQADVRGRGANLAQIKF